ncbi:hypothetical protein SCD75_00075 (plasmid) [Prescottella equi]|uniref:Putative integral membrane protein n=1 Tax=Rhodococcus hoagii TaxID=43767 RepID=A0A1Z1UZ24_RHOHA|nr:hypothetical protein [Prescottella equi]ARX60056.1 putative integral membrane protein [Prescottella equi]WQB72138.1 hypothetical protein SCD75_00075 [Prescottella equi]
MSIIAVIAALALAGLLVWKIGAPIARFGGALMVVSSLAFIVMGDPIAVRAPWLVAGAAIWLAGHFLSAYQHRFWRSRLAENIVVHTPLRHIDPVGGAEYREARREKRAARAERPAREAKAPAKAAKVDHFAEWERELTDDVAPATETPAKAKAPARRPAAKPAPGKAAGPSRGVVYGKRAAKAAGNLASRTVPGARVARSDWRFIR